MVFNSLVFLEFGLLFFGMWQFVRPHESIRYHFLIIGSCLFYAYGGWWFVPLLLFTATVDFVMGKLIFERPAKKKLWLTISLCSNLGMLGLFKYSGFLASSINAVAKAMTGGHPLPVMHLILPIGISFYTFQSLSYIFDIYRGDCSRRKS
jgi:alginate O-acetyltransferase complex protein AlgI